MDLYAAQDMERNQSDTLHTSSGQRRWERNSTPAFEAEMVYYVECGSINRDVRFPPSAPLSILRLDIYDFKQRQ